MDRRDFLKQSVLLGSLLLGGPLRSIFENTSQPAAIQATETTATLPTYIVEMVDGMVRATAAPDSGLPAISDIDAATVIMKACIPNSRVLIKAGTYDIAKKYGVLVKNSNVELYGDSNSSTVLKLADGMNDSVLNFESASNMSIHDLQIDGNRMNQSQSGGSPAISGEGITAWHVNGLTIENCYIHDCRDFGINLASNSNVNVLNNQVYNCDANGITVGNMGEGSGTLVSGNTVNGASDVGITAVDGVDVTVDGNTVMNVNMDRSPWGNQSHVGLMAEGDTFSQNCRYTNNNIMNCGDGIASTPYVASPQLNKGIVFDSNKVSNCLRAAYVNNTEDVAITNNMFDGIAKAPQSPRMGVLRLGPKVTTATITGNQFLNVGDYVQAGAVIQLLSPSGTFSNNVVNTDGGKYPAISAPNSGWTIANNTILPSAIASRTSSAATFRTTSPTETSTVQSTSMPMSSVATTMPVNSTRTASQTSEIPGFPWESVAAGIGVGLATLSAVRERKKRHKLD
jgi:parallel beta-helix repeat protein